VFVLANGRAQLAEPVAISPSSTFIVIVVAVLSFRQYGPDVSNLVDNGLDELQELLVRGTLLLLFLHYIDLGDDGQHGPDVANLVD
jgi:hypothetical protein